MVIAGGKKPVAPRARARDKASTEPAMVIAGGPFPTQTPRERPLTLQRSRRW